MTITISNPNLAKTITSPSKTGLFSTGFVSFSPAGLAANPRIAWDCWHDIPGIPLEEVMIAGRLFLKVKGNFWQPDLEMRFFAKGSGKRPDENWIRTLDIAIEERPKLVEVLFCQMEKKFPIEWFQACEPVPGLTVLEKRYRRHLPNDFKGLGVVVNNSSQ